MKVGDELGERKLDFEDGIAEEIFALEENAAAVLDKLN